MKIRLEIVENPDPDPYIDRLLDQMVKLSRIADTYYMYLGEPRPRKDPAQRG